MLTSVVYAARTTAARCDAPGSAAGVTCTGAYRPSIPLTASYTADCTIAAMRVMMNGAVPADCAASNMIRFHVSISFAAFGFGWLDAGVDPTVVNRRPANSQAASPTRAWQIGLSVVIFVLLFRTRKLVNLF